MNGVKRPEETVPGISRRVFIKGVGGFAGLGILGILGCSHHKKKPVVILPKPKPIVTIKYKDKNLNGKFDPWTDDRIGEDWFFREGENLVIYIVPENAQTGDEIEYSITGPNRKVILSKRVSLTSEQEYIKIDGYGTNVTEYFVKEGGYGTFTLLVTVNGVALEANEFKISAKPRG